MTVGTGPRVDVGAAASGRIVDRERILRRLERGEIGTNVGGVGIDGLEFLDILDAEHRGQKHEGRVIAPPDRGVEHRRLVLHPPPGRHRDRQGLGRRRIDQGRVGPFQRFRVAMRHQRPGQVRRGVHADGGGLDIRRDPLDPVGPVLPGRGLGCSADIGSGLQGEAAGILREIGEFIAQPR